MTGPATLVATLPGVALSRDPRDSHDGDHRNVWNCGRGLLILAARDVELDVSNGLCSKG
jgi:hypothetical protein